MKIIILFEACAFLQATIAFTIHVPAQTGSDAGKCVYQGDVLNKGMNYIENCEVAYCEEDGAYTVKTCTARDLPEDCKLGDSIYLNSAYPKCCVYYVSCSNGTEYMADFI